MTKLQLKLHFAPDSGIVQTSFQIPFKHYTLSSMSLIIKQIETHQQYI